MTDLNSQLVSVGEATIDPIISRTRRYLPGTADQGIAAFDPSILKRDLPPQFVTFPYSAIISLKQGRMYLVFQKYLKFQCW